MRQSPGRLLRGVSFALLLLWLLCPAYLLAAVETLYPDGGATSGTNAWSITGTQPVLNDANDSTHYSTSTNGTLGYASVANPTAASGCIDSVKVWVKARTAGNEQLNIGLRNGTTDSLIGAAAGSQGTGLFALTTTSAWYWEVWTSPPGGSWNLNSLEVHFSHQNVGGASLNYLSEAYIEVTYHLTPDVYSSKTGLTYCKIQEAIDALGGSISAPEFIEIRSSNTHSGTVTISITGTSSTNRLTIKAQTGQNPLVDARGFTRAFLVTSTPYVIFEGIHVKGDAATKSGFKFSGSANGTVRNCIVEGLANNDGTWTEGAVAFASSSNNGSVENSTLYRNYVGVEANASTGINVKNSIIEVRSGPVGGSRTYGISLDDLGGLATSDYNLITRQTQDTNTVTGYNGVNRFTLGDWQSGAGQDANSIAMDPKFVDEATGNFRLKSTGGRWTSGTTCAVATFVDDAEDSPALDRGEPTASYANECAFNGNRRNLGAFGNTVQASKTRPPRFTLVASADVTPANIYSGQANVTFLRVQVETERAPTLNQVKLDVKGNGNLTDTDVSAVKVYLSADTILDLASDTHFGSDATSDIVTNGAVVNGSYAFPSATTTTYLFILLDISSSAAGNETIWVEQRFDNLDAIDYYATTAYTVTNNASPVYFQTAGGTGQAILLGTSFNLQSRVDNIAGKTIGPGQSDVHMMSVRVEATGSPTLTGVSVNVGGTVTCSGTGDVTSLKVYISNDTSFDASDTLFGSTPPTSCTGITVSHAGLAISGTKYILFLINTGSSSAGKTVSLTQPAPAENLYTITSGTKDAVNDPYTSSTVTISNLLTVCASGCNHTTIQAAVNAIPAGITTSYIVEVRDSLTYAEMVTISGKGSNATNTITLRAQRGQTPTVDPPNAGPANLDGFRIGDAYVTIEGFRITGPELSGIWAQAAGDNCIVRNNVIDNIPVGYIAIRLDGASGCQIVNNTIYHGFTDGDTTVESAGVYFTNTSSNTVVRNNIFVKAESAFWFGDTASQTGFSSDYNLFWEITPWFGRWNANLASNFSAWKVNTNQDANSLESDPLFVNAATGNFRLQSTAGYHTGGGCSAPTFSNSASDSPGLDRGHPAGSYSHETNYNGDRINLGAFGNTCFASRTRKQFNLLSRVDNAGGININAGDTNKHFMSVRVETRGDPTLTGVNLTIGGSVVEGTCANDDIAKVSVYVSSDAVFDSSDTLFGSFDNTGAGIDCVTSTVAGSYTGSRNATYYLLFLLDIKAGATVGQTVKVVQAAPAASLYTASSAYTTTKSSINDPYESSLKTIGQTGAGPKLLSAVAEGTGAGITSGDTVKLTFDKGTNAFAVNSANINSTLCVPSCPGTKTWGGVSSASWSTTTHTNDTLTVTLDGAGSPNVAIGDSIAIGANTIEDGTANDATGSPPSLSGSWEMQPDWKGQGGLAFEGAPVIRSSSGANTVFAGNNDGKLYAYKLNPASPPNAETKWTYNVGAEITSLPNVRSNTIYFGATDGKVYALLDNGTSASKLSWSPKSISTSPVKSSTILWDTAGETRIYVGGDDNRLHAFRASDGTTVWSSNLGGIVSSTPSISGDGYVYVGSENGSVVKIDITSGTVTSSLTGLSKVTASPFMRWGKLYIGAWNNTFYAIDTSTWTTISTFCPTACELNDASLLEFKGPAWVTSSSVYVGNSNGKLYCLQRTDPFSYCTGWSSVTLGGELLGLPVPHSGNIYVTSTDGRVYVVNESSGSLVKYYDTGDAIVTSPAFFSGKMAVSSKSGKVYVFPLP